MALTKKDLNMVATCDGCLVKLGMQVKTWQDGVTQMKSRGWVIKRIYDKWKHGCPDCMAFQSRKLEESKFIDETKNYNPNMSLQFRIAQITGGKGRLVMPDFSRFKK